MQKGSAIIILDKDGNIFLQQKDQNAPTNPNLWALWGGACEENESFAETASRELKEELGILVNYSDLKYFKEYKMERHDSEMHVSVFYMLLEDFHKPILGEGKGLGFFNEQEIQHLRLSPFVRVVLIDFYKDHAFEL